MTRRFLIGSPKASHTSNLNKASVVRLTTLVWEVPPYARLQRCKQGIY